MASEYEADIKSKLPSLIANMLHIAPVTMHAIPIIQEIMQNIGLDLSFSSFSLYTCAFFCKTSPNEQKKLPQAANMRLKDVLASL